LADKGLKWDLIKMELRMGAISYSKFIAKQKRDNVKELLSKQVRLENCISANPTDELIKESEKVKNEIEEYNEEKARGAWLRSKAEWMEYGEKNSRFFLNLEKRNRQVKNIAKLINDKEDTITEQEDILQEELNYYKNLYTQPLDSGNRDEAKNFFMSENIPKISRKKMSPVRLIFLWRKLGKL
jgi:hypothetical protein